MRHLAVGVFALAFLLGTTAQVQAECRPAAIPFGDPSLVQSVTERLAANGVTTSPIDGCPVVRVHLERRGEQLHLRVADGYQRRGERVVQDLATAAAVIESWTLQEITDGTLPELALPPSAATATVVAAAVQSERIGIAVAGHSSVANDGATWLGGELAGCARIGWACIGASTTLLADTATTHDASRGVQRSMELHALAIVEVPRSFGRFTISPGIGVGYGWMTFAQQHMDAHMMAQSIEYTSHAFRTRGHLAVSRELGGRLALVANLFGDVAALRTAIPDGPTTAPRARVGLSFGLRLGLR